MNLPYHILNDWQLVACAAGAGLALGVAVLVAIYLTPLVRLRLANDRRARERVLVGEMERLRRIEDALAVHQEHGHPDARALRDEAEVRGYVLPWLTRRLHGRVPKR